MSEERPAAMTDAEAEAIRDDMALMPIAKLRRERDFWRRLAERSPHDVNVVRTAALIDDALRARGEA